MTLDENGIVLISPQGVEVHRFDTADSELDNFLQYSVQDVKCLVAEVERLQRYETKVDKIHDAITRMENQEIDGFDFGEEVLGILGRANDGN